MARMGLLFSQVQRHGERALDYLLGVHIQRATQARATRGVTKKNAPASPGHPLNVKILGRFFCHPPGRLGHPVPTWPQTFPPPLYLIRARLMICHRLLYCPPTCTRALRLHAYFHSTVDVGPRSFLQIHQPGSLLPWRPHSATPKSLARPSASHPLAMINATTSAAHQ